MRLQVRCPFCGTAAPWPVLAPGTYPVKCVQPHGIEVVCGAQFVVKVKQGLDTDA